MSWQRAVRLFGSALLTVMGLFGFVIMLGGMLGAFNALRETRFGLALVYVIVALIGLGIAGLCLSDPPVRIKPIGGAMGPAKMQRAWPSLERELAYLHTQDDVGAPLDNLTPQYTTDGGRCSMRDCANPVGDNGRDVCEHCWNLYYRD